MSRAVGSEQLPATGSRGRLRRSVDRFPHFVAHAGATEVRLGTTVLRTSTAGPAALAVVSGILGRW